jgi:hypothetical protein
MTNRLIFAVALMAASITLTSHAQPARAPERQSREQTQAPSLTLRPEAVYSVSGLKVVFKQFAIQTGPVTIIPLEAGWGVTGAVILGPGQVIYKQRNGVGQLRDDFHAVVLRFNPKDYPAILPVATSVAQVDQGAAALAQAILDKALIHSYARAGVPLPVGRGALSATFFSKTYGHLLISDNGQRAAAVTEPGDKYLFGFDLDGLERQAPGR